jgi:uncharacterized protein
MFLDVSGIRQILGQKLHYEFCEQSPAQFLDSEQFIFREPLKGSIDVMNTGNILVLSGKISGEMQLNCGRCLENFLINFETDYKEKFCHVSNIQVVEEEGCFIDEVSTFEGNRLELENSIREAVYSAIPMKTVCREDCKGLCAVCGTNLNLNKCECTIKEIDPRLAELEKFFKN